MNLTRLSAALLLLGVSAASAATIRVSSAGDAATLDPHSQNVSNTMQIVRQMYEPLVNRGPALQLEPALAESWSQVEPTRWRFKLRPDVHFHDGSLLTAADVVFSLQRAAAKTSNFSNFLDTVARSEAVDARTVDIVTTEPDPILLDKISDVAIMSRAWCEANHAEQPQNTTQQQESFSLRHENGTGPYVLTSREVQVKTVLTAFPGWWGHPTGNVTQYVSLPIENASTRVAAFLSGEIDVMMDPPVQSLDRLANTAGVKLVKGPEIRTMFLVMDQSRDHLLYSDVQGGNPFKDRRVRQALYQATDIEALAARTMHGFALPSGLLFGPGVRGYPKDIDTRLPYDPQASRALLGEAGYPTGFAFTLDCPNNRYMNDSDVCTALAAMWAKIGLHVSVNALPLAQYFPKIQRRDTSMYFMGSGSSTLDAYYMFQIHLLPPDGVVGNGIWNLGGYNNPALTRQALSIPHELDQAKRDALIKTALEIVKSDISVIPLYDQIIAWAMHDTIDIAIRADNQLEAKWATVK